MMCHSTICSVLCAETEMSELGVVLSQTFGVKCLGSLGNWRV